MNTTDSIKIVNLNKIKFETLSDYDQVKYLSDDRQINIMKKLTQNFPPLFKPILKDLCTKYTDIFGLETESITTNNFYKQDLRVKDKDPVYIKNYRIPHAHKE